MSFSGRFYDHSAIIAPQSRHDGFLALKEEDPSLDFALYTREDVEAMFSYASDERALIALLKRSEKLSYDYARESLKALSAPAFGEGDTKTLNTLKGYFADLLAQGLLYKIPSPEKSFEGRSVIISGYPDGTRISAVLGGLHNMAIAFDFEEAASSPVTEVDAFPDPYEELHYVYNRIAKDLESGTPIDAIYLLGADESYDPLFEEFSRIYGFAVEPLGRRRLYDAPIYRLFRAAYLDKGLESAIGAMRAAFQTDKDGDAIEKMGRRYAKVREGKEETALLYDEIAKTLEVSKVSLTHRVHRLQGFVAPKGAHVYLLNFAMGVFPRIQKEEGLLLDGERLLIGLPTSEEITKESLLELKALLASPSVQAITFKATGFGKSFFPSSLVKRNGLSLVEAPPLPYEYAHDKGAFLLASLLDEAADFLREDPRLKGLSAVTEVPLFRSYDYRYVAFKPLPIEGTRSYSPTSLKTYYGCPFSYYLSSVLKIEGKEVSFLPRIGVLFHKVLEGLYRPGFDFEGSWSEAKDEEEAANGPFSPKEEALLPRLKDECASAVAFYKRHDEMIKNIAVSPEGRFALPSPADPSVIFACQYDKIVTFGDSGQYFCVIDYKSGAERFHEELLPFGLSLQLPFYAYYAMHEASFTGKELVGLFIGPLLSATLVKPENRTMEEFEAGKFKLDGVFANDLSKLLAFDPSARQSTLIKGLAYGEKGFRHYRASFTREKKPEDFVALADKASALTLEADQKIRAGDFAIAPVKFKAVFNACERCQFRDVCYRPEEAVKELSPKEGDEEAEEGTDGEEMDE